MPLDSVESLLLDLLSSLVLLPAYGILASTHIFFTLIRRLTETVTEAQLRFVDVDGDEQGQGGGVGVVLATTWVPAGG